MSFYQWLKTTQCIEVGRNEVREGDFRNTRVVGLGGLSGSHLVAVASVWGFVLAHISASPLHNIGAQNVRHQMNILKPKFYELRAQRKLPAAGSETYAAHAWVYGGPALPGHQVVINEILGEMGLHAPVEVAYHAGHHWNLHPSPAKGTAYLYGDGVNPPQLWMEDRLIPARTADGG